MKIDLVFRTVGERTSDLALKLAVQYIQPDAVHIIDNVRPFAAAVQAMLAIEYDADYVVFMDADCLILEEMRPFLERNDCPYVDCYVLDKFRGKVHMGVHVTRIDVVKAMQKIEPPVDDMKYVLRPESRLRNLAMKSLGLNKSFVRVKIFHDFEQNYEDIFCKYALRELRSRTPRQRLRLQVPQQLWSEEDMDFVVAEAAIDFARERLSAERGAEEVAAFIEALPAWAEGVLAEMGVTPKKRLTLADIEALKRAWEGALAPKERKVFGIGLSRTGTKSLSQALELVDWLVIHNPADITTYRELSGGNYRLTLLDEHGFDGMMDIAAAPFFAQLDKAYPGSKFILTVRERESWLDAMERHWDGKMVYGMMVGQETKLSMRRFLRAATYGTYQFDRERMGWAYDRHHEMVYNYFRERPDDLLVLNVTEGEGWEKVCPFLGIPLVEAPFPHVKKKSKMRDLVVLPGAVDAS
ncbi:MAG TPA: sulfotransferase [Anaerolineae bacterium]|nr:sulfotransferase [Anaerolineae bacterium]